MTKLIAKTAAKAGHSFAHHVAVVMKGGSIKAIGFNHGTVHAEVTALSKLWPDQRAGCTVWSIRVRKDGSYAMALPCEECTKFLVDNGVRKVYYSNSEGELVRIKLERAS